MSETQQETTTAPKHKFYRVYAAGPTGKQTGESLGEFEASNNRQALRKFWEAKGLARNTKGYVAVYAG